MRKLRTDRVLCVDLEATCWEGGLAPEGMRSEVIEIGIVEADPYSLRIIREARYLIRPTVSEVSSFCTQLTGLTAEELRREGRHFSDVMRTIAKEFGPGKKTLVAWGNDWGMLEAECCHHRCDNPFPLEAALNLGHVVTLLLGSDRRLGLDEALDTFGIEPTGEAHRGLDDARNTMLIFLEMARQQRERAPKPSFGMGC